MQWEHVNLAFTTDSAVDPGFYKMTSAGPLYERKNRVTALKFRCAK